MSADHGDGALEPIAVVGMALRFPGAADAATFWRNLREGVESARAFTDAEILASGVDRAELADPRYVRAGVVLDGVELFDAAFFGFTPREAELMDPAQRLFLECAWEALETAGHDTRSTFRRVGVFAGAAQSSYLVRNLLPHPELIRAVGGFEVSMATDKDFVPTRVSYKLNLTGPSVNVSTACSTSLVAVHLGCQSLLTYQSDVVLAGGATVRVPQSPGYLHQEGGIVSPDGHCRAFDARAQGTVEGSGVGIVVLKRLADALADGDTVYALIKGSAVNNDGSAKVGFTAPSVDGQAAVIAEALSLAGTPADTIGYVEAHGTGTTLGDPIEIEALTRAFRVSTPRTGFCAIGSVKTNIGHLDTAAGVAGLIKTVLALHHRELPPSLHFEHANPLIDFAAGPFTVNTRLRPWSASRGPRRAGVSSFGIGGTNAHVVLEEAPAAEPSAPSRRPPLLVLSARTESALDAATDRLAAHLAAHPSPPLADVAHTLARGRRAFDWRRVVVVDGDEDATRLLARRDAGRATSAHRTGGAPAVVFMFPGQGAQVVDMGRGLYDVEPLFKEIVDGACETLRPLLGVELRDVLYPRGTSAEAAALRLQDTAITQPAMFVVEYALARLLMSWGITPAAMIGHSVGEYVAACLAEVFSLEDALRLVATRGRLMAERPRGAMLAVALSEAELRPRLGRELSLAAVNGPELCVASGALDVVTALRERLEAERVACAPLRTSHAFHSAMMDGALAPFADAVAEVKRQTPQRPFVSNVTGTWITPEDALAPEYWARHLRETVRFGAGLAELFAGPGSILLEVGPGTTLADLASRHPARPAAHAVLSSLGRARDGGRSDAGNVVGTVGRLWLAHVPVDWAGFYAHESRRRVPLPTYPFERQRYWIDPPASPRAGTLPVTSARDVGTWLSVPTWRRAPLPPPRADERDAHWLVLAGEGGLGSELARRLSDEGRRVTRVTVGAAFRWIADATYEIDPARAEDWDALLGALAGERMPDRVVDLWPLDASALTDPAGASGLHRLLFLARALDRRAPSADVVIDVVSSGMHAVTGAERLRPELATLLGPILTIPRESPRLRCRGIDLAAADDSGRLERLMAELRAEPADAVVAYRGGERSVPAFEPARWPAPETLTPRLRHRGVYLITGGLGGIGLTIARWLAESVEARLVLTGRTAALAPEARHVIEACGARVLALRADVADRARMAEAIARAREEFGAINGVVHAVGVPDGALIVRRTVADVEAVLAPKARGALVLDELLRGEPLDFMVLCSSLASIEAPPGQVAYTAANAFLDAFAHARRQRGDGFTVSVNWDSWAEVGMAVAARERLTPAASPPRASRRPVAHPLFTGASREGDRDVYASTLGEDDWVLGEHRLAGRPTLPATAYLELALAAFTDLTGTTAAQLDDVLFLVPLTLDGGPRCEIQTALTERPGGYDVTITSLRPDGTRVEHARARVAGASRSPSDEPGVRDLARLVTSSSDATLVPEAPSAGDGTVTTGPRWRNLRSVRWVDGGAVGVHELPEEFAGDAGRYRLHPALLDAALNLLVGALDSYDEYLPFSVRRLRAAAVLPGRFLSHARRRDAGAGDGAEFDVTLFDEHGAVLAIVEGYELRKPARRVGPSVGSKRDDESVFAAENYGLALDSPGILESVRWSSRPRRAPAPGEVEIEVMAAGLNFKEVLLALGVMRAPDHPGFGLECAGRVVAVGSGAGGVRVGDDVIAFADRAFARFATTPGALVAPMPSGLTFEAAATIPIAFVTAYHALIELGRLSRGERVLIHAAAGGVGLAAVQVARWRGAEILATAGSEDKREFLRSLGVGHVFDSRSLAFADEITAVTGGVGVDVVLNSLGGEYLARSLALLAPFGRFLELGRRDIESDTPLGLKPFERSLAFFAVSIGPAMPRFGETFRAVLERFAAGDFRPLPSRAFPFAAASEAFAHMAQSRHIGKIVLVSPAASLTRPVRPSAASDAAAPVEWIRPAEGIEALRRILAADAPQVLVSTQPLAPRGHAVTPIDAIARSGDALPAASHPRPPLDTEYVAPRDDVEARVAAVWQTLLGLQTVGVHDDFFALGGHSLLGVQIVAELRQRFGVDLPISAVFDCPTIERLSRRLGEVPLAGASRARPVAPVGGDRERTAPLSSAQHGLWFFHQLSGPSSGYNLPGHLRLTGPLDAAALGRAIGEIVARHEILRTTFPAPDGVPLQEIHEAAGFTLPAIDLRHLPPGARDGELRRLARAHVERPFDLRTGPLFRVDLVRVDGDAHVLLVTMHHIVADGWAMGIFVKELIALYQAFAAGRPSPLPRLPLQYADFARWQRDALTVEVVDAGLRYWRERLAGAPAVLDLPTDRPRPARATTRGSSESFTVSATVTERLKALAREDGTTLFAALAAAFGALLARYSGQTDLLIGSPVANRHHRDMEALIGLCINTVPLRIDVAGNPSFGELLGRMKTITREAFAQQTLPFEKLVEELRPRRDGDRNPLVQVLFALQNVPLSSAGVPGLVIEPVEFDAIPTAFDLMLTILEGADGLTGMAIYNADLFDGTTIARMMSHLRTILASIAADPGRPVLEIPLSEGNAAGAARAPREEPEEFDFGDTP